MRKNIYIKDSDLPLFEWAEEEAGDSLSSILAEALRLFKQRKEMEAKLVEQGYETIKVDVDRPGSNYVQTKQFEGKWILPGFVSDEDNQSYAVAHTKRGQIVITREDMDHLDQGVWDFQVFPNLHAIKLHNRMAEQDEREKDRYPEDLVNAIAVELGEEHVEVLDI